MSNDIENRKQVAIIIILMNHGSFAKFAKLAKLFTHKLTIIIFQNMCGYIVLHNSIRSHFHLPLCNTSSNSYHFRNGHSY